VGTLLFAKREKNVCTCEKKFESTEEDGRNHRLLQFLVGKNEKETNSKIFPLTNKHFSKS
jgi:hypothetical protein